MIALLESSLAGLWTKSRWPMNLIADVIVGVAVIATIGNENVYSSLDECLNTMPAAAELLKLDLGFAS